MPRNYAPEPPATFLLNTIDPVTEVRYFSPSGRRPVASTFEACGGPVRRAGRNGSGLGRRSRCAPSTREINVVSFTPEQVPVDLDIVSEPAVPVEVAFEPAPPGLTTGTIQRSIRRP